MCVCVRIRSCYAAQAGIKQSCLNLPNSWDYIVCHCAWLQKIIFKSQERNVRKESSMSPGEMQRIGEKDKRQRFRGKLNSETYIKVHGLKRNPQNLDRKQQILKGHMKVNTSRTLTVHVTDLAVPECRKPRRKP